MAEPEVAVVLPVYRNRASLTELATRLHAALDAAGKTHQRADIVLVGHRPGRITLAAQRKVGAARLGQRPFGDEGVAVADHAVDGTDQHMRHVGHM